MTNSYHHQPTTYSGFITDTTRWHDFQSRSDDIFICTPPKCGTTWTQAICAMLIFGSAKHGKNPNELSPWIDAKFEPLKEYLEKVEAQSHRRFFKTHTPLDGIPYVDSCTYLVVVRDPRDAYLSGIKHRDNMINEEAASTIYSQSDDPFGDWLNTSMDPNNWDAQCFEAFVRVYQSYWSAKDTNNVHLYHYADMLEDLRSAIASMAEAISVSISNEQLDEFVEAASFGAMKKEAERYAPYADIGFWKNTSGFFANGGVNQWESKLTADQNEAFLNRASELLSEEERSWLLKS